MSAVGSPAVLRRSWPLGVAGMPDLIVGIALSVGVFALVHVHLYASDPHAGVVGGLLAVLITLPVVWARRYPLSAVAVAAAGALISWLAVGHYVRCGAVIPAGMWLACVIGLRLRGRAALVGMMLVLATLQFLCLSDSAITPVTMVALVPLAVVFWLTGRTIRSRAETMRRVAERNEQLTATRERTARLAVETDRARIRTGLDAALQGRLDLMATTAARGRAQVDDAASACAAFATIAVEGRKTLTEMREVVDALRIDPPRTPAPNLERLTELVAEHGGRLVVDGDRRPLAEGVELSAYRIVEQLLQALDPAPAGADATGAEVRVHYGRADLHVHVSGPGRADSASAPQLAVAQLRVEVHGGRLTTDAAGAPRGQGVQWAARIPLSAEEGKQ
jgi:hypothetical protein